MTSTNMAPTNRVRNLGRWIGGATSVFAALLAFPLTGSAQCIMCSLSVASTGERGAHVFRMAILAAAIPTFLMFGAIMLLAYLRRNPVEPVEEKAIDELLEQALPAAISLESSALTQPSHQQN